MLRYTNKTADTTSKYLTLRCFPTNSSGLPRCKSLTKFSLFVSSCFAVRLLFKMFCFLCFTSSVSFTCSYASVNSSCAHAPPQANPRALAFFFSRMANSRGWGHFSCQMPRGVDEGRGQMPRPRDRTSPINTAAVFIHCTIIPLSAFYV